MNNFVYRFVAMIILVTIGEKKKQNKIIISIMLKRLFAVIHTYQTQSLIWLLW